MNDNHLPPIAWAIGGSDSCSGAGIQADLKTMNDLGVHCCSVITAVTAQNTQRVSDIVHLSPIQVGAQMKTLMDDLPPDALKIGMLGTEATLRAIHRFLDDHEIPSVCDPILKASSGRALMDVRSIDLFATLLFKKISLLTPNIPEAEMLTGIQIKQASDIIQAADALLAKGCKAVLIKGGHAESPFASDYFKDADQSCWLMSPKLDVGEVHGTGCVLSSAITSGLAKGLDMLDAIVLAKSYINQSMRDSVQLGKGTRLQGHHGFPYDQENFPILIEDVNALSRNIFAPFIAPDLPLYAIVEDVETLERFLKAGIQLIQLRMKNRTGVDKKAEVDKAVALGKEHHAQVIINDDWKLAIEAGAYGVHLGQDDLPSADLEAISKSGMILGLSTHSFAEMAKAWAYNPSYIAIGTIFQTDSKTMDYEALGIESFLDLACCAPCPIVGIGGLSPENAYEVAQVSNAVAVISSLTKADDLDARILEWQQLFAG